LSSDIGLALEKATMSIFIVMNNRKILRALNLILSDLILNAYNELSILSPKFAGKMMIYIAQVNVHVHVHDSKEAPEDIIVCFSNNPGIEIKGQKMLNKKIRGFEQFAEEYSEEYGDVSYYKDSLEKFVSRLGQDARVLELACGPGNVTEFIHNCRNDLQIECVDIAPAMIALVKKKLPRVICHLQDIKSFKIRKNHYDGMICSFGLPYFTKKEAGQFFYNISNGLKKNGVAYLSTMQGDLEGFESFEFACGTEIYIIYHTREFLDAEIEKNGLRIIEYEEQVFHEEEEDEIDMIYILGKK